MLDQDYNNMFTIYSANCLQNNKNTYYPHKHVIRDAESLKTAVSHDYVCASYKSSKRSIANYISSDCLAMDCDNDSVDPAEWVTPELIAQIFPDVTYAIHYSRNHMRPKGNNAPRPKFHVFFPITPVSDSKTYAAIKQAVLKIFPHFDANAADAGRFFFGTADPQVEWHTGSKNLTAFLADYMPEQEEITPAQQNVVREPQIERSQSTHHPRIDDNQPIPEGQRNNTLYHYALRVMTRYGKSKEAIDLYRQRAAMCQPPLERDELNDIWLSAAKKWKEYSQRDDYIQPDEYGKKMKDTRAHRDSNNQKKKTYRPWEYTDVEQARKMAEHFKDCLCYSDATSYMVYEDNCWIESEPLARGYAQKLTDLQRWEAKNRIAALHKRFRENGMEGILAAAASRKTARVTMNDGQRKLLDVLEKYEAYYQYALSRQNTTRISACLKEVRSMVLVNTDALDADPFLLNTPGNTYDLRQGLSGARPASPDDHMTKITAVTPSDAGEQIWRDALNTIFCGDQELIDYVQMICGLSAIGQVNLEAMILAYGDGRNCKSTFWNTISRVLGSYSGCLSTDALTFGCMRNIKPEMAEARGKRLLIAAELPSGARLNDSIVKQLCSTDPIQAEKKYQAPFSFIPSHTLVLYTNHLPKVDARDCGTWRRLIVIPFRAKIDSSSEIKNYANYLYDNAGGAVLSWIIEGAQKVIQANFILPTPAAVIEATSQYKAQSDWFGQFLDDCCEIGSSFKVRSEDLYQQYRQYAIKNGDPARSTNEFYPILEQAGYTKFQERKISMIRGLRFKPEIANPAKTI